MSNLPVVAKMAERFEMTPAEFERTVRATVCPSNITNEQFVAFLMVAKEYNLNPITKQIYALDITIDGQTEALDAIGDPVLKFRIETARSNARRERARFNALLPIGQRRMWRMA